MKRWVTAVLLSTLCASFAIAQDEEEDPKARSKRLDKEAKAAIKTYQKKTRKAKDEDQVIFAIRELGKIQHIRILNHWKKMLGDKSLSTRVRRYVIQEIQKYEKDPAALKVVLGIFSSEVGRARVDDQGRDAGHELACDLMRTLRNFKLDEGTIKKLIGLTRHKNISLANTAIMQLSEMRRLEATDSIIGLMALLESSTAKRPEVGSTNGPGSFVRNRNSQGVQKTKLTAAQAKQMYEWRRKQMVGSTCKNALTSLLKESKNTSAEYKMLWAKNKARLMEEEKKRREMEEGDEDWDD